MVFCNKFQLQIPTANSNVTILILVDGFLQFQLSFLSCHNLNSHNPYFSRWFSAIYTTNDIQYSTDGHNPYFSRWFSAINIKISYFKSINRHNPYFSRWFSAIKTTKKV